jgi:hypothetical protein
VDGSGMVCEQSGLVVVWIVVSSSSCMDSRMEILSSPILSWDDLRLVFVACRLVVFLYVTTTANE